MSASNPQSDSDLTNLWCNANSMLSFFRSARHQIIIHEEDCSKQVLYGLNSLLSQQSSVHFPYILRSVAAIPEVNYSSNCMLCILLCR